MGNFYTGGLPLLGSTCLTFCFTGVIFKKRDITDYTDDNDSRMDESSVDQRFTFTW